jgi:rhodanese-related sulfurtransferase
MKRSLAWLVVAAVACGGTEAPEQAATEVGPDTLPASVPALEMEEGIVIVTPDRVREWQDAGEPFVLVDARDEVQYGREHIPGAVNIPYVDIRAGANLPALDSRIVLYCSDKDCPISQYAHEGLRTLGYTNLYDMRAGIQGWKDAGYPTVIGEAAPDTVQ